MGWVVYITRAVRSYETQPYPIAEGKWLSVIAEDSTLRPSADDYYERQEPDGSVKRYHPVLWIEHPDKPPLFFMDGAIHCTSLGACERNGFCLEEQRVDPMNANDRRRLRSGDFDRESWAALWDRLPDRARRSTLEFVLQKLHAIESNGLWSMSWHYETGEQREESGAPIFEDDQPGDVITFKGLLQVGTQIDSKE